MPYQTDDCREQWLTDLVADRLSVHDQETLVEHLDSCTACSARLEQLTADATAWNDAATFLSDSDFELEPFAATRSDLTTSYDAVSDNAANAYDWKPIRDLLAPTDDPEMLGRLGSYEISAIVGRGGMGVVFKAFDPSLRRYVAIKTLAHHLAGNGPARSRFAREAQAAAAVTHENVIEIYGVSESKGVPYLVMPYVRGVSLEKRLSQSGWLGVHEILRIALQAASGLAAAHAQGLVHRDIKPANILLSEGTERVTITDFGLARAADDASLTCTGFITGTPLYMSPEQARGEGIDYRSDLFCLGSVMYAMCTGRPPFRAETGYGVLRRIVESPARPVQEVNPTIPTWLCHIVQKLLSKSSADRFQSAQKLADVLEQCLAYVQQPTIEPLPACLVDAIETAPRKTHVRKLMWPLLASCGALATLLLVIVGTFMSQSWTAQRPSPKGDAGLRPAHSIDRIKISPEPRDGEVATRDIVTDDSYETTTDLPEQGPWQTTMPPEETPPPDAEVDREIDEITDLLDRLTEQIESDPGFDSP